MKYNVGMLVFFITVYFIFSGFIQRVPGVNKQHFINVRDAAGIKKFFKYTDDRIPFISSHRGGPRAGFPENYIPTFENTLARTWSILEIDPHYTKDSAIVLMHDKTLNRTSNGSGKVSDYTLEEIRKIKLKDTEGAVTEFGISTLDEVLEWSKGKTIMVLDEKDVPAEVRARKIIEHHAEASAMLIVYSFADAVKVHAISKDIMMEVMIPDAEKLKSFDSTGVSWSNVVAFVTHTQPTNAGIYKMIHDKGSMCITGSSRTIDREFIRSVNKDTAALKSGYDKLIRSGTDIIEADLGIEAGESLEAFNRKGSSKKSFFHIKNK